MNSVIAPIVVLCRWVMMLQSNNLAFPFCNGHKGYLVQTIKGVYFQLIFIYFQVNLELWHLLHLHLFSMLSLLVPFGRCLADQITIHPHCIVL